MRNVIVGTAGHVDHGKTSLIKVLTGIDTDRLKEEKKRGITIELGFAEMPNEEGLQIGIIDVPGHEKFVRNMLAGIGGIDLVLLVVAADEGVMPQTVEHFEILKMLEIKRGIIVVTKADLVDEEWLALVSEDVRDTVRGTFLEDAPLVTVSSYTGQNIEELKRMILEMAKHVENRRTDPALLRIPIDRVFTIGGFGTVITGTLTEGQVSVGDEVQIYPGERITKVRSLQVHGSMVDTAYAGQRTAVNLMNLKKEELQRGDVLAAKGSLKRTRMLDVKLRMFDDAKRTLRNESRIHLNYGSAEALCKVVLLDREVLNNGEEGYAQLRLEEEIAVRKGDRFIVRFYSPVETIGGGEILDAVPAKQKRFREDALQAMQIKDQGETTQVLLQTLLENGKELLGVKELALKLGIEEADRVSALQDLTAEGKIIQLSEDFYLHKQTLESFTKALEGILSEYHTKYPLSGGMQKGELRKRLTDKLWIRNPKIVDLLLRYFTDHKILREAENKCSLPEFRVVFSEAHQVLRKRLEEKYLACGYEIPELDDVISGEKEKELMQQMAEALASEGVFQRLSSQHFMHRKHWDQAMDLLRQQVAQAGQITLAEFRDLLGTSRKYAVLILEYLDQQKITALVGDARVLTGKEQH